MFLKILNSIFPIHFWIFLIVGIIFLFTNVQPVYGYVLLNVVLALFFINLGVVIHEIGHLLFAKLAGGDPKRIILGKGHEVIRFDILGVKIILNKKFSGGFAFANFSKEKKSKLNTFLYTSGGFVSNLIMSYLCYLVFGFALSFLGGKDGLDVSSAFIFANILLAIFSLIPYKVDYLGVKIPSDGLAILKLPFSKKKEDSIDYNDFFEAQEKLENKHYDEAIELFKKYSDIDELKTMARFNVGLMYSKKGDFVEALNWINPLLDSLNKEKNRYLFSHVNNGLAWINLIQGNNDLIDLYSKTAYSINPNDNNFKGTRGSVLIELGKVKSGVEMLKPLMDFKFPNSQTLCVAIYLYYGMTLREEPKKANKYFDFIIENFEKLDVDDKMLWKKIQNKIEELK